MENDLEAVASRLPAFEEDSLVEELGGSPDHCFRDVDPLPQVVGEVNPRRGWGLVMSIKPGLNAEPICSQCSGNPLRVSGGVSDRIAAPHWKAPRMQTWTDSLLSELFLAFADRLNAAESYEQVGVAVSNTFRTVAGADEVVLMMPVDQARLDAVSASTRLVACAGRQFSIRSHPRLWAPGILGLHDASPVDDEALLEICDLLAAIGIVAAAHLPVGQEAIILLLERRKNLALAPDDWTLLRALAAQAEGALRRMQALEEARELSLTDPLTGLGNRRKMDVLLDRAWLNARGGEELSLALLDLNEFKQINDERGHLAGDQLLRTVADVLRSQLGATDLIVRYGGDEFLILLPGYSLPGAAALLLRIAKELDGKVSFLAGVAEYHDGIDSMEDLLHLADIELYSAKRSRQEAGMLE